MMRLSKPYNKPDHPGYPVDMSWRYRNRDTYIHSKRQLNRKEMKRLGVKNS